MSKDLLRATCDARPCADSSKQLWQLRQTQTCVLRPLHPTPVLASRRPDTSTWWSGHSRESLRDKKLLEPGPAPGRGHSAACPSTGLALHTQCREDRRGEECVGGCRQGPSLPVSVWTVHARLAFPAHGLCFRMSLVARVAQAAGPATHCSFALQDSTAPRGCPTGPGSRGRLSYGTQPPWRTSEAAPPGRGHLWWPRAALGDNTAA